MNKSSCTETLMWKEICETGRVLRDTAAKNRDIIAEIASAAKKKKPKSVIFAARGTSDHASQVAKYLIEIYKGIPVSLASPSVFTVYDSAMDFASTLVIAVSQSGHAADAIEVLSRARAAGALTVAVTNDPSSPMAAAAEYHLDCAAGPEVSVAATKTFSAQMYLLAMLVAKWSGNTELGATLRSVPALVDRTLRKADDYRAQAARYRFALDGFVLARGYSYPLAMEMTLKMQETSYIRARAYAISDFYHGPVAQVSDNTPIFIIAIDPMVKDDVAAMLDRVRDAGADILSVTCCPEVAEKSDAALLVPENATGVAGLFCAAVAMQLFACAVSVTRGLNPDNPRGLKKVTITK